MIRVPKISFLSFTSSESILQQENLDHNMVKQNRPNLTTKYQTKVRSDCNQRCTLINTNQPHTVHIRRLPHGGAGFLSSFLSMTSSSPSFFWRRHSVNVTALPFLFSSLCVGIFWVRRQLAVYPFSTDSHTFTVNRKALDKYVLQKQLFRRSFNLFPAQ